MSNIVDIAKSSIAEAVSHPSLVLLRILSTLIFLFLISAFPTYSLTLFMSQHGFFSYDLVKDINALQIIFNFLFVIVIATALLCVSSLSIIAYYHFHKGLSWKDSCKSMSKHWHVLILNIFYIAILAILHFANQKSVFPLYFFLGVLIALLIGSLLSIRWYVIFILALSFAIYAFPIFFPNYFNQALTNHLARFGLSGRSIDVFDENTDLLASGELIYLSPDYIYIKKEKSTMQVITRSKISSFIYKVKPAQSATNIQQ